MASDYGEHLKVRKQSRKTLTLFYTLQTLNQFVSKSDGKDKLCATIQYACLFLSAGEPGQIKKIQASVAAARKVFRILKPLESLTPLILTPGFDLSASRIIQLINKVKGICMACYFGFDHVVWMGQIELITTNPNLLQVSQKISTSCWLAGSLCTIATQSLILAEKLPELKDDLIPTEKAKIRKDINKQLLILLHGCLQAALALGLLGLSPGKNRYIGLIGMATSALNCYLMYPPSTPAAKEKKS
eukprot:g5442.t1